MSELKVNKITPKTGTSIQLGESGDTITIPCGATLTNNGTATGFGLSFCTTVKTSPFTATANKGFLINTGSAVTVTLPASPSTGAEVIIVDQTGQSATNNITIGRNSSKIKGLCQDATLKINRGGLRLVYSGSSQGWITATAGNDASAGQSQYTTATGGTITTSGDYKIHTFNSDANFVVSQAGNACGGGSKVSYLVVAGGGGGGGSHGAGAGAGGFREGKCTSDPYSASPLNAPDGITITAQTYPITVGAGGALANPSCASGNTVGGNSIFSTITSTGGGKGSTESQTNSANAGGSGGGGTYSPNPGTTPGGSGNTPPVSPPQGSNGGNGGTYGPGAASSGGGGGATAVGTAGTPSQSGPGGAGATTSINASPVARAGGGAGGGTSYGAPTAGTGGTGGGGAGSPLGGSGTAGTANTGGGGGGGAGGGPTPGQGATGGSGVVIIRYKYQN